MLNTPKKGVRKRISLKLILAYSFFAGHRAPAGQTFAPSPATSPLTAEASWNPLCLFRVSLEPCSLGMSS